MDLLMWLIKLIVLLYCCCLGASTQEWPQLTVDYLKELSYDVSNTLKIQPINSNDYASITLTSTLRLKRLLPSLSYKIYADDHCFEAKIENPSIFIDSSLFPASASFPPSVLPDIELPFIFCYDRGYISQIGVLAKTSMELQSDVNKLKISVAKSIQIRDHALVESKSGFHFENVNKQFSNCRSYYLFGDHRNGTFIRKSIDLETCKRKEKANNNLQWTTSQNFKLDKANRLISGESYNEISDPDVVHIEVRNKLEFKSSKRLEKAASLSSADQYMLYIDQADDFSAENAQIENIFLHWVKENGRQTLNAIDDEKATLFLKNSLDGNFEDFGQLPGFRSMFVKALVAVGTDRSIELFGKLVVESKVSLLDAARALNSIESVEQLSASSIKILFELCINDSLKSNHYFEKLAFENACYLQVAHLSKKFVGKLRKDQILPGLHVITEIRDNILKNMETIYRDATLPENQRLMALRVIGNLGHPSSLSLLREILVPFETDYSTKHDDAEKPNLIHKVTALDSLRHVDEMDFERSQLVLDVLRPKAQLVLHAASVSSFFDSRPTSSQLDTFWSLVERHGLQKITAVAFELKVQQSIASSNYFEKFLRFCKLPALYSICSKVSQFVAVNNAEQQVTFSRTDSFRLLGLDRSPADFQAILYNSANMKTETIDLFDSVFRLTGEQFETLNKLEELEQREFRRIANGSTLGVIELTNGLNSVQFTHLATGQRNLVSESNTTHQGRFVRYNGYDLLIPVQLIRNPSLIKDVDRVEDHAVFWPRYKSIVSTTFLGAKLVGSSTSIILGIFPKSTYHIPKPLLNNEEIFINPAASNVRPSYYIGSKFNIQLESSFFNMTFGLARTSKINPKHTDQNSHYSISIEQYPALTINKQPVEVPSDQTPFNQRHFNGSLFDLNAEWRWLSNNPFKHNSFGQNVLNIEISEPNVSLRNSTVSRHLQVASPIRDLYEIETNLLKMHSIINSIKNGEFGAETEQIQQRCERDTNTRDCTLVAGETSACTQCKRLVRLAKESVAAIKTPISTANDALCAQTTVAADYNICKAATSIFYNGLLEILSTVSIDDFICKFVVTPCASADELKMKKANRIPCSICENTTNSLFNGIMAYQTSLQTNILSLCPKEKEEKKTCSGGVGGLMKMFSGMIEYGQSLVSNFCRSQFNCVKDASEIKDNLNIQKVPQSP